MYIYGQNMVTRWKMLWFVIPNKRVCFQFEAKCSEPKHEFNEVLDLK